MSEFQFTKYFSLKFFFIHGSCHLLAVFVTLVFGRNAEMKEEKMFGVSKQ